MFEITIRTLINLWLTPGSSKNLLKRKDKIKIKIAKIKQQKAWDIFHNIINSAPFIMIKSIPYVHVEFFVLIVETHWKIVFWCFIALVYYQNINLYPFYIRPLQQKIKKITNQQQTYLFHLKRYNKIKENSVSRVWSTVSKMISKGYFILNCRSLENLD